MSLCLKELEGYLDGYVLSCIATIITCCPPGWLPVGRVSLNFTSVIRFSILEDAVLFQSVFGRLSLQYG